jgi:hypothetical protein
MPGDTSPLEAAERLGPCAVTGVFSVTRAFRVIRAERFVACAIAGVFFITGVFSVTRD